MTNSGFPHSRMEDDLTWTPVIDGSAGFNNGVARGAGRLTLTGCRKTLSIDPLQGVNRSQAVIPNEVRNLLKLDTP